MPKPGKAGPELLLYLSVLMRQSLALAVGGGDCEIGGVMVGKCGKKGPVDASRQKRYRTSPEAGLPYTPPPWPPQQYPCFTHLSCVIFFTRLLGVCNQRLLAFTFEVKEVCREDSKSKKSFGLHHKLISFVCFCFFVSSYLCLFVT